MIDRIEDLYDQYDRLSRKKRYVGFQRFTNRALFLAAESLLDSDQGCPKTIAMMLIETHKVAVRREIVALVEGEGKGSSPSAEDEKTPEMNSK